MCPRLGGKDIDFVKPGTIVLGELVFENEDAASAILDKSFYLRAGPHNELWFRPKNIKACIVTCGGLCPGLNNVIREICMTLIHTYGADKVFGIPYGYRGFYDPKFQHIRLEAEDVQLIHHEGGTILGSSRGGMDKNAIMDAIIEKGYNQVYIIGGDGTHRGAGLVYDEVRRRGLEVSVAGIPKTIDNDIALIDKSFGFETAVEEATRAIKAAHVEAVTCPNGISIVKLMGRSSGFIAMHATLASRDVNACLIPEVPFTLEHLLNWIHRRVRAVQHTLLVVAEGAGQELVSTTGEKDASGNVKFGDIGTFLERSIHKFFKERGVEVSVKLIDPTYQIRTVPANSADSVLCSQLAMSAVHGVMAGYSGFTTATINTRLVWLPFADICGHTRTVDPKGRIWQRLLASTNQPRLAP